MRFDEAYGGWKRGRLTQEEAARLLGVCERTYRRYRDRYEEQGMEGLVDRRLGQISHRSAPVDEDIALADFLREKQFVRSLSQPEIESLKAVVRQVRCSGCGAAVDLARDAACSFCRSPIAVLDALAVDKALATLGEAERKRTTPNAEQLATAFESLVATHKEARRAGPWTRDISPMQSTPALIDLVAEGIGRLFR